MSKTYHSEGMFIDSGAYSLYNIEVRKQGVRTGKTGRQLEKPPVKWSQGDYSYYNLAKGTLFRKYCDSYASFIRKMKTLDDGMLFTNVDAIHHPELTWEIQQFFETEHGLSPVPVIHYGTPLKWVDRYLEAGRYDLLGIGGLGTNVNRYTYLSWANELFYHLCPESNNYLPIVRTHGFAMTSWELICAYPWWSVDSATWVKVSAYGWLYVPKWSRERQAWRWDRPPLRVNASFRSPQKMINGRHYEYGKCAPSIRETVDRWLEYIGLAMGSVNKKGETVVFGAMSHHRARSIANLRYLKGLEESRPPYPHPLDPKVIKKVSRHYRKGFDL